VSLRLRVAAAWTPEAALVGLVDRLARSTLEALDALVAEHAPGGAAPRRDEATAPAGGLEQRRAAMASAQGARVRALVEALGRERAVEAGREALYPVGVRLGEEARRALGVGDGLGDLERAARILYRALGIDFTLERREGGAMLMRVHRCALACRYSEEACEVLSAADEGVVAGLSPGHRMRFERRMTGGPAECLARIEGAGA